MSMTAAEFIERRGGPSKVAADINALSAARKVTPGAVRVMKHRNKIPREMWPEIISAYPDVSLDDLIKIEAA